MLTFPVDLYHESNALINSGCSAEPVQQLALQHEISTTTPFFPFSIFPTQDKIQTPTCATQVHHLTLLYKNIVIHKLSEQHHVIFKFTSGSVPLVGFLLM